MELLRFFLREVKMVKIDINMQGNSKPPKYIKKERFCAVCKKKLSGYNTSKYCNIHKFTGQLIADKDDDIRIQESMKKCLKLRTRRK